jgi:hypothetical protein
MIWNLSDITTCWLDVKILIHMCQMSLLGWWRDPTFPYEADMTTLRFDNMTHNGSYPDATSRVGNVFPWRESHPSNLSALSGTDVVRTCVPFGRHHDRIVPIRISTEYVRPTLSWRLVPAAYFHFRWHGSVVTFSMGIVIWSPHGHVSFRTTVQYAVPCTSRNRIASSSALRCISL